MELSLAVAAILGAVLIGAISPGPSFILVARTAIAVSRWQGIAAALGMGVGATILAGAALLGLHVVLANAPSLFVALKIGGALYLAYLAFRLWRGADRPMAATGAASAQVSGWARSFALGLVTQLSNPKTAVAYASIFTALLPAGGHGELALVILPPVFAIETGWYTIVAMAFSAERPRRYYLQSKRWIDRVAASAMGLLALKLASDLPSSIE
jgi:threonine/homoserine/homoserine lactone efflux protein